MGLTKVTTKLTGFREAGKDRGAGAAGRGRGTRWEEYVR